MSAQENFSGPKWLEWAQRLQATAQTGLTYAQSPYDVERYRVMLELAAEIVAEYSEMDVEQLTGLFAEQQGYATPKIDVRGVVFRDDAILLVKEREDGGWTLPGGWADVGETPTEAVVKEIREESGYETRAVKLLAVYDRNRQGHPPQFFTAYKLYILCELTGGTAASSVETEDVGFFREDALPPLSLNRVLPGQIARMFAHYRHPEWPADLD
jgi:ADP-ribose pyrophosphatase YjhB (NUDIX family)